MELLFGLGGETIENLLYFNQVGAWTPAAITALGLALIDWWGVNMAPNLSTAIALIEVFGTDLTSPTGSAVSISTGLPLTGESVSEPMSNNVAPCISLRTASRGRSFRGRNYIGGIPENLVSGNIITGSWLTAVAAAYLGIKEVATENGCDWVVVSRFSGVDPVTKDPIPRAEGISTPILSVLFVDNVVDSQRKRLPNH